MPLLTYDWPTDMEGHAAEPPGPGDTLVCLSRRTGSVTGTAYLILTAHEVMRIEPVPNEVRMRYTVARIELREAVKAPRWEALVRYSR